MKYENTDTEPIEKEVEKDEYYKAAMEILHSKDPMGWMIKKSKRMVVGDTRPNELTKLSVICPSIPSANGIHIDVSGPGEAGKSFLFEAEYSFVPDGMKYSASSISQKALDYNPINKGSILYADEKDLTNKDTLRVMKATIGSWQYTVKQNLTVKDQEGLVLTTAERLSWWITHNDETGDMPFKTRWFIINMSLTDKQQQKIYNRIRKVHAGLKKKILGHKSKSVKIHKKIYEILLEDESDVVIAQDLDYGDIETTPRNVDLFGDMVRCYAKLNMFNRERDKKGRIIATKKDVKNASRIWNLSKIQMKTKLSKEAQFVYDMLEAEYNLEPKNRKWGLDGYVPRIEIFKRLEKEGFKISDSGLTRIFNNLQELKAVNREQIRDIRGLQEYDKSKYGPNTVAFKLIK